MEPRLVSWVQRLQMASIGRTIAVENQKSAVGILSWGLGGSVWPGLWSMNIKIIGRSNLSIRALADFAMVFRRTSLQRKLIAYDSGGFL